MAANSEPKPDAPLPSSIHIDFHLPAKENKLSNLSGAVEPRRLQGKYEVFIIFDDQGN